MIRVTRRTVALIAKDRMIRVESFLIQKTHVAPNQRSLAVQTVQRPYQTHQTHLQMAARTQDCMAFC